MKKINILCVAAAALLAGACASDKSEPTGSNNGVLTVGIKSESPTRALIDATTTAAVVDAFENNVYGFSAYVFDWNTGDLEASVTSADGTPVVITGLNTAGTKRVVVIANGTRAALPNSFIPQFETDPNYSRMEEGYLALADQSFSDLTDLTTGFLMTGENTSPITLVAGNNTATITVKRIMSKVQLGDITFDQGVQLSDLADFNITGVSIQRAALYSTLGTGAIDTPTTPAPAWAGGYTAGASISTVSNPVLADVLDMQPYLTDLFTTQLGYTGLDDASLGTTTLGTAMTANSLASVPAFENDAFYYVLPSDDTSKFTLLTLKGTYRGTDFYYPIEINDPDSDSSGDKLYVKRNTIYTLNIKFKNFTGVLDPDLPGVAASLEVTVVPANWEGPVIQNATW